MLLIKFRKRDKTTQICVVLKNLKGKNKEAIFKEAYRNGEFDTGYHLILSHNGLFEADREIRAVAGHNMPESENSIYVLADTLGHEKISDAQKFMLSELQRQYDVPIKFLQSDEV